jgi:L-ascorbate metabolism protein UlaG (beta-lactamase superfamily)
VTLTAGAHQAAAPAGRERAPALLDPGVVVEPLQRGFPLWLHTFSPATSALHLARYQLPVLRSYLEAPDVHVRSARAPGLRGGPFVDVPVARAGEVAELVARIESGSVEALGLADDLASAYRLLVERAPEDRSSLDELAADLPARLRPHVELVYDVRHQADLRVHEGGLYRDRRYRPERSVRLGRGSDRRPFAFSTPRLGGEGDVHLDVGFDDDRLARLLAALVQPVDVGELATDLELGPDERATFAALFVEPGPRPERWQGPGLRVRYFGHAGVLLETAATNVLVDPFPSAEAGPDRFSFRDLPARIDHCLITHGHADHLVLEALLRLRPRIGTIVVPRSAPGALQDPSPAACLRQLGFTDVVEVSPFDAIAVPEGEIVAFPFFGEHAELAVSAKVTYGVRLGGRAAFLAADTRVPTGEAFAAVGEALGPVDLLFTGMECDGAPLTWLYGPLLASGVSREASRSRTLSGSDAAQVRALVEALRPAAVQVYAMGFEPWLDHVMAMDYAPDAFQLREMEAVGAWCRDRGTPFEVVQGEREWVR